MQNSFSTVRLKTKTLDELRRLKNAYESTFDCRLSMDQFFGLLMESSRKSDPDIWEIMKLKSDLEEEISRKIQESRMKRNAPDSE